jgi:dCMP deaminase
MPKKPLRQSLVVYLPVLHRGYINLFDAFPQAKSLYLIDRTKVQDQQIDYLRKDLRQLTVEQAVAATKGLDRFEKIDILDDRVFAALDSEENRIILPDEDISRLIGSKFRSAQTEYYSVFLRWDRRSLSHINQDDPDKKAVTTVEPADLEHMQQALGAAKLSTDIWRRVGAVLVADKKVVEEASNTGEPNSLSPWLEGDPRNAFNRGVGIEMSVYTHAEALLVARAAKHGLSLKGASLYATDFPCPACAKLIAHSGIANLYYKDGYAVLDGKKVLEEHDVKIKRVVIEDEAEDRPEVWVPYKK